jgi:hypothetical protein
VPNKHRIISLRIPDRMQLIHLFTIHPIDSSFHRLESLILHGIKSSELKSILPNLTTLPRLASLTISFLDIVIDYGDIYRSIFRLPSLKYNKFTSNSIVRFDSISLPTDHQFSSLEQLVIDYPCALDTLYNILSWTPKLRRLICTDISVLNQRMPTQIPLRMFNLTQCSIQKCSLKFDQFEIFIKQIFAQLQYLRFSTSSDSSYLDAHRWERVITKYMPYLHTFQFEYEDLASGSPVIRPYHAYIDQFSSQFWIEKQWCLDIQANWCYWTPSQIIFAIQRYDKFAYPNLFQNECMNILKLMSRLTVRGYHLSDYCNQMFIDYIRLASSFTKITYLHFEFDSFSIDLLVQILNILPSLDSLTILFVSSDQITELTEEKINMIYATSTMNKITKLNIQMIELNYVEIFLNLCPRMEYLQIKCRNYTDLELIIRLILMKRKSNLYSLCFWMSKADDSMVKKLQAMISFEKLLVTYKIQRVYNRIYLQWQRQ